jgi:hypothetical protein
LFIRPTHHVKQQLGSRFREWNVSMTYPTIPPQGNPAEYRPSTKR